MNPNICMIASILNDLPSLHLIAGGLLLLLVVVIVIGLIRAGRQEEQKYSQAQKNLKFGDIVVTPAGITGEVLDIRPRTLKIRSGDTVLEIQRDSVSIPSPD